MDNLIGNLLGKEFRFAAFAYPDHCMRHRDYAVWLDATNTNDGLFMLDSSFDIVPGLSGTGISFQSKNYPDRYIRHQDGECYVHQYDGSDLFKNDASWILHVGLADAAGYSFESTNYRGQYMRHRNSRVRKDTNDGSTLFSQDATWEAVLLVDSVINGEWNLIYGNNNIDSDWTWSQEVQVGLNIEHSESTSVTNETSWKVDVEAGSEDLPVKAMFETSASQTVSKTSASSWTSSHLETTGKSFSGTIGQPFYLWQWYMYANTADGAIVKVETNLYEETTTSTPPTTQP
ncbi:MAG: AbfB domain-containing protein [Chloroflexi bacterium]|nr:AbfB domain-containing protein [Chloroflexota bacterium]